MQMSPQGVRPALAVEALRPAFGPVPWIPFAGVVLLCGALALLQLVVMLFALALFDAVIPSRSAALLAGLLLMVAAALAGLAALDVLRARMLCRIGLALVEALDRRVCAKTVSSGPAGASQVVADLERLSRFAAGPGPCALSDALWLPVSVVAIGWLHPLLSVFVAAALIVQALLVKTSEAAAHRSSKALGKAVQARLDRVRSAPVPCAHAPRSFYRLKAAAARRPMLLAALGKALRLKMQAGGLAVSALLVISDMMSPGAMIAASLIMSRAFASMDAVASHWRAFAAAQRSYGRIVLRIASSPPAGSCRPGASDLEFVDARESRAQGVGPGRRQCFEVRVFQSDPRLPANIEAVPFVKQDVDRHADRQVGTQR
jgi:ABC-type protease/lipase transport system fused ATPase/permease subunit